MAVPPKSSIVRGFSIIFTIHFGGFPPILGNPHIEDICVFLQRPNIHILSRHVPAGISPTEARAWETQGSCRPGF